MATLSSLPQRPLLNIILNLRDHRNVLSLALQNRRFHDLADLITRKNFRRVQIVNDRSTTQAWRILLDVLRRPQLGTYIRHLEIDYGRIGIRNEGLSEGEINPADWDKLKEAIRTAGFNEEREKDAILHDLTTDGGPGFPEYGNSRAVEALGLLLASVSPRLESISCSYLRDYISRTRGGDWPNKTLVENENPGSSSWFGQFLQRAGRSGDTLPFLREVRSVHFLPDTRWLLSDGRFYEENDFWHSLNVVRRLPAIESVIFEAVTDSEQGMSIEPPPRRGNYTKLVFHHSYIRESILLQIIKTPRVLKELTYTIGGRCMERGFACPVNLGRWLPALLVHRNTLEHLDLDVECEVKNNLIWTEGEELHSRYVYRDDEDEEDDDDVYFDYIDKKIYEQEWAAELNEMNWLSTSKRAEEIQEAEGMVEPERPVQSLRSFHRLKHLSMGVLCLYYLCRLNGDDQIENKSFSLIDYLPPNLETLRIYGYDPTCGGDSSFQNWTNFDLEGHLSQLMEQKATKLPSLKTIEGVEKVIPHGENVDDPDHNEHLLWKYNREGEFEDDF